LRAGRRTSISFARVLCEGCGRVVEAACGDLPGAVERMCAAQGFRARVYALRITGTCRQCAEKRR